MTPVERTDLDAKGINIAGLTLLLGALTAFAPFATDLYLPGLPEIAASFRTDSGHVQLSLSVFFLGLAVGQIIYGPLIDRLGRRLPLLIGVGIFTVTSFLIAFAPTIEAFIGLRLLQGLSGCAGMVVGRAAVRDLFDERETARVFSMLITVIGIAPIVAPILGGYVLTVGQWPAVFVLLGLFGLTCLAAAARYLPETLPVDERNTANLGSIVMTYLRLATCRAFILPALVGSFAFGGLFSFISGSSFVFIEIYGLSEQHYGWLFGIVAAALMVGAQVNRALLKTLEPRTVFAIGIALSIAAAIALNLAVATGSLILLVIPLWFIVGVIPLISTNAMAIAMAQSSGNAGSASALLGLLQFGTASIVSAVIGSIHNDTAYPMSGAILGCGLVAGLLLIVFRATEKTRR
ncbi:multidrug effflux MFS transporter [Rhodobium gokarnense]|uniref:Bcr/CflA family efflux transporter n=1 Tax=Rhodobium gokarnense TaxID=364296 RepID=A0ABT3HE48_9HYPH|nr:multidrug effflux MFS transporter [Rhodobium gokarnense]MCW2308599.1 DHA1 family bicyclomycin/chloramphenicol resistance-like MFS transporter [Rhodobium gokarnense]